MLSRRRTVPGLTDAEGNSARLGPGAYSYLVFVVGMLAEFDVVAFKRELPAETFGVDVRTVSAWNAELRAMRVGGRPLLSASIDQGAHLHGRIPWNPEARAEANLQGYEVPVGELLEALDQDAREQRDERARKRDERNRARALRGAPLRLVRPAHRLRRHAPERPEGAKADPADVDRVAAAWDAVGILKSNGTRSVAGVVERRTINARIIDDGLTVAVLLDAIAGAAGDSSEARWLRSGKTVNPFGYVFPARTRVNHRLAQHGRVRAANGLAPSPAPEPAQLRRVDRSGTSLIEPSSTLATLSQITISSPPKPPSSEGSGAADAARIAALPRSNGPAPMAPRSFVETAPAADALRSPEAQSPPPRATNEREQTARRGRAIRVHTPAPMPDALRARLDGIGRHVRSDCEGPACPERCADCATIAPFGRNTFREVVDRARAGEPGARDRFAHELREHRAREQARRRMEQHEAASPSLERERKGDK